MLFFKRSKIMLKTPRKLLLSLVSILLLGACSNTNSSKTLEEEVKTTAAYLDKVPYMSPESTATKNAVDFPVRAQGDPNDEEGYINITNPTPQYYLNKFYALSYYDSFDTTLNYAKKIKDKAIDKCKSLNEWTDHYLILFDIGTKELEFYFQEEAELVSDRYGGARPVRFLYKSDICKNENGKINYHLSEYDMFLDATDEESVFQQVNISYLEDSYYMYSYCVRDIEDYNHQTGDGVDSYRRDKCKAIGLATYYIDMNYPDLMYCFQIRSRYTLEDEFLSSEIHKYAYDMVNGFEIDYYQDKFSFYGTNGLPLISIFRGRSDDSAAITATINLYSFSGWDYCYTKSILNYKGTEDFKFHLSNDNINNVPIGLGVFAQISNGFAGNPELYFRSPTYESFELYLNQAGLQYTGNSNDLEYIQKFYNNEINFTVFGEDIKTISDTTVSDFVQSVCENYKYSELEQIINYESNPIPLSSTVIEASPAIVEVLFEIENNVTIDDKYVHLSGLSVSLKKTPYFKGGNEYECVVELYDSEHDNPKTVATTTFTYGVDEKIKFNDIKIEDLPVNIKKGKYYFVLNFNGYTLDIVES